MHLTNRSQHMTSFFGHTFHASVRNIKALLGNPQLVDNSGDDKVNFNWIAETENGTLFTIYDWKEYRSITETEIIQWHIGGFSAIDTMEALDEITVALNNL